MEQQRPPDTGKGLLVHSEKSLSIRSLFYKFLPGLSTPQLTQTDGEGEVPL